MATYKLVFLGDTKSGKTALIQAMLGLPHSTEYIPTLYLGFDEKAYRDADITLQFYEPPPSTPIFKTTNLNVYYKETHFFIICCDLTMPYSNLEAYINDAETSSPNAKIILVGTKQDSQNEEVSRSLSLLAEQKKYDIFFTSAKNNIGLNLLSERILRAAQQLLISFSFGNNKITVAFETALQKVNEAKNQAHLTKQQQELEKVIQAMSNLYKQCQQLQHAYKKYLAEIGVYKGNSSLLFEREYFDITRNQLSRKINTLATHLNHPNPNHRIYAICLLIALLGIIGGLAVGLSISPGAAVIIIGCSIITAIGIALVQQEQPKTPPYDKSCRLFVNRTLEFSQQCRIEVNACEEKNPMLNKALGIIHRLTR